MKKRLLYAIATLVVLVASSGVFGQVDDQPDGPPQCNPLTDPNCRP